MRTYVGYRSNTKQLDRNARRSITAGQITARVVNR